MFYYKVTVKCSEGCERKHEMFVMARNEFSAVDVCAGVIYKSFYEGYLDCSAKFRFDDVDGTTELYIYVDEELYASYKDFKAELVQDESEVN